MALSIDILMEGYGFQTSVGIIGFCGSYLIEGGDKRVLVDTAHGGRRVYLQNQLEARGLKPTDIDAVVLT
ncbi:MAG: MBL fold metallo-hydrolase, partial [Dehalococcoidia bacterium]|nr:MBL fold metallo-hydrolase [Dehalococcoidia bacterium]